MSLVKLEVYRTETLHSSTRVMYDHILCVLLPKMVCSFGYNNVRKVVRCHQDGIGARLIIEHLSHECFISSRRIEKAKMERKALIATMDDILSMEKSRLNPAKNVILVLRAFIWSSEFVISDYVHSRAFIWSSE
ncbi:hypothetical protein Tco_0130969 [Tanacetum coccineum]